MQVAVDYTTLFAAAIPSLAVSFAIMKRAIGAEDSLDHRYGERVDRSHSRLISDQVCYKIGELILAVLRTSDWARVDLGTANQDDAVEVIVAALQRHTFVQPMAELTSMLDDDHVLRCSCSEMKKLRGLQALCLIPAIPTAGVLIFYISVTGYQLPLLLRSGCALLLAAAIAVIGTVGIIEWAISNRLARIFRKYA
jgi:hypothetical protein